MATSLRRTFTNTLVSHSKMINFVLMQTNDGQMEDLVHLAAELGIDQINFKQCDVIRGKDGRDMGVFGP